MFQPFDKLTRQCILCRIPRGGQFQQRCEADIRAALVYSFRQVRRGVDTEERLVETGVEVSKNRSVTQDGSNVGGLVNRIITTGPQKMGSALWPQTDSDRGQWILPQLSKGAQVKGKKRGEDNGGM